jgi:hypothetical protein
MLVPIDSCVNARGGTEMRGKQITELLVLSNSRGNERSASDGRQANRAQNNTSAGHRARHPDRQRASATASRRWSRQG